VTVNLPASVSYIYDSNGNLTSDGTRGFDYDDENQLIRLTVTNSWKSEFTYDGKMRRRICKEFTWSGSWAQISEARYIYDGMLVIQERAGNNLPTLTLTRGRDLGGSLQGAGGIGGLLARLDGASGHTAYFHADGNGNVAAMVTSQQIVVAKYIYDPFGNTLSKSGPLADANTYRFSSQEYHQPSGLSLYLYRAYVPNLQRWLNKDPLGEFPDGPNLYDFVGNNPMTRVDIDGLTWRSNWLFFWDWLLGRGDRNRYYRGSSVEPEEMRKSDGGKAIRDRFYKNACKGFNGGPLGSYGTVQAYLDTAINPSTADLTSTAFQVGGFSGATVKDNGNGTVTFCIPNDAGMHSFFLHIPPNNVFGANGPMGTIRQAFCWTEPIDKNKCPCPK